MKTMKKSIALLLALSLVLLLAACGGKAGSSAPAGSSPASSAGSAASDWPKQNITIVVGFGAGGDTDLGARVLADALTKKLGVSVIVENLAGGTGVVGRTEMLTRDDNAYTLMFDQPGSPITQVLMGNTTYSLEEAGTPICIVGTSALALCVAKNNAKGIQTMDDFVAYAKAHPGELTYAIPGQFTAAHLAALNAFAALGINVTSVPTDGTATCVTETLGNHVDAMIVPFSGAQQYVESGDMNLLVLSAPSSFAGSDAPLMSAYGVSDYETWYCLWGGMSVEPAVAQRLSDAVEEILKDEAVVKSLTDLKIDVDFSNREETVKTVESYREIIKNALVAGGAL